MSVPAGTLPGMKIELTAIDPDVIEDIIGTDSYDAALGYVRRHAVGRQTWAGAHHALFGIVLGSHGDYYTPAIFFSPGPPLKVLRVHCDCAARHGCEHVAAGGLVELKSERRTAHGSLGSMVTSGKARACAFSFGGAGWLVVAERTAAVRHVGERTEKGSAASRVGKAHGPDQ